MTRSMLVTMAAIAAGAAQLLDVSPARAQGGRLLKVGGATVVVSRPTGRYQAAPVPRPGAVPQFRALSPQAKSLALKTALETVETGAPNAAVNKLTVLPGGVTLVATRAIRVAPPVGNVRTGGPARFQPLARSARDAILQAAAMSEESAAHPSTETPAAQPAQATPFTLTPHALIAPGKAYLHIDNAQFFAGMYSFVAFINNTGSVRVVAAGTTAKKHMLHFQVFNPTRVAYDYTIMSCDGTTTKVSAATLGTQDIVVFCVLPQDASMNPTLASLSAGAPQWYFVGVEVTPM